MRNILKTFPFRWYVSKNAVKNRVWMDEKWPDGLFWPTAEFYYLIGTGLKINPVGETQKTIEKIFFIFIDWINDYKASNVSTMARIGCRSEQLIQLRVKVMDRLMGNKQQLLNYNLFNCWKKSESGKNSLKINSLTSAGTMDCDCIIVIFNWIVSFKYAIYFFPIPTTGSKII